mmetsp:Transcript_28668/g.47448  ORF Transcript_28668/g.47448 Transcript_28668/m.47448 type:complete len:259 (-) Transcript_28668:455-1231(-)
MNVVSIALTIIRPVINRTFCPVPMIGLSRFGIIRPNPSFTPWTDIPTMFVLSCSTPSFRSLPLLPKMEPFASGSPPPTVRKQLSTTAWNVLGHWPPLQKPTSLLLVSMKVASVSSSDRMTQLRLWIQPVRLFGPKTMKFKPPLSRALLRLVKECQMASAFLSFLVIWGLVNSTHRRSNIIATVVSWRCAVMENSSFTRPRHSVTRHLDKRSDLRGLVLERETTRFVNRRRVSRFTRTLPRVRPFSLPRLLPKVCLVVT